MAKKNYTNYLKSGYFNTAGIAALQQQAAQYVTDPAALQQQAMTLLTPGYNSNKLSEEQALQTAMTGYNNQLSGLGLTYDQQERSLNSQYNQSQNTMNASALKRGLGRSTIPIISGTAIENARNTALGDVTAKKTDAYNDLYSTIANTQAQSAAKLAALQADLNAQAEAKALELRNSNLSAQAALNVQIAQLNAAGYQAYMAGKGGGGGSNGSSSTRSTAPAPTDPGSGDTSADAIAKAQKIAASQVNAIKNTVSAAKKTTSSYTNSLKNAASKVLGWF